MAVEHASAPSQFRPLPGLLMLQEAGDSADAVRRFLDFNYRELAALGARLRKSPPNLVLTCARGSSDAVATYGKYLVETMIGVPVSSVALSVASVFNVGIGSADALCIVISQSGASPDLLATVRACQSRGTLVVALVNVETSPLAKLADIVLPLRAGPEQSVAATKSCIASLVGIAAIVAAWREDGAFLRALDLMPSQLNMAFELDWSAPVEKLINAHSLYVIGRGISYGIAQEAALKLKETACLHAEAFSAAEVRHGPMAIVNKGFPIIAFGTSDPAGESVRSACADFAARGAAVFLAEARVDPGMASAVLPAIAAVPAVEPVLSLQSFYRLAHAVALARGRDPDRPPHLTKETRTR